MIESRTALRQGTRALIALLLSLVAAPGVAWAAEPNEFAQALERGPAYAALAAFGSGLLVALTPCVYPMIAITVGVFGARKTKSHTEGALLSAVFVAGIVIMFVPLGVIAGLTGGLFGSVLSNPWVLAGMGALFLAMALSMFGAFDLDLPSGLKNRLAAAGGTGYWGALVLGLICGPIAAPCTGPFLTGILAWIAQTQSAMWGAAAMAAFALGIGVPFFFVGAFAVQLPKSGAWMLHVKSLLGIILSVVALYFLAIAFPWLGHWARPGRTFLALMVGVVVVGLLLGAVHKSFQHPEWTTRLSKLVGVLMVTWGGFLFVESLLIPEGSLAWETPTEGASEHLASTAQAKARQEQRPLLIDFTAAWCVACKEISKITFADQRVRREAARFVALMVDATDDTDPAVETTLEAFNVQGLPAVILFDSSGKEVRRFTQFVDPDRFLEALERIN